MENYGKFALYYLKSSEILSEKVIGDPELYEPCMFLLRHSLELQLKHLIYLEQKKMPHKHKLLDLWNKYKEIMNATCQLIPYFNEKECSALDSLFLAIDGSIGEADRFRYPFDKNNKPIFSKRLKFDDSGVAPDLKDLDSILLIENDNGVVVTASKKQIENYFCLVETAKILFRV